MEAPPFDFVSGQVLLVDKPETWTSFDVVKKIKHAGRFKKVGHAGTLDPLATGLLILCTEKQTRTIDQIQAETKEYVATIKLGVTTPSLDRETSEEGHEMLPTDIEERLQIVLPSFAGEQMQVPPIFSAILVDGQRAYESARRGRALALAPRPINIYSIELLSWQAPEFVIRVRCSKGTYIRSMARDIAERIGTKGYLTALRRTKIGDFSVENAWDVTHLAAALRSARDDSPTTSKTDVRGL